VAVATTTQIHAAGVGGCGTTDVSGTTPFVIGSTSKSFTALAVLQLVDDGKLDLDAPVQQYVPAFTPDDQRAGKITVRQVLQQTSGLSALAGGPILKSAADGTAAQALRELRTARLAHDPGTRWEYANANYLLAGLAIEAASGTDYATFIRQPPAC
jgi:CubicO group peptidase (beta-lactamase class C family)